MTVTPLVNAPMALRRLKRITNAAALVAVSPAVLTFHFFNWLRPDAVDATTQGYSQCFSLIPGVIGVILRRAFYRQILSTCARDCTVSFGTIVATRDIVIGEGTYIGAHCNIGHVVIGRDVLIGSNVTVLSGKHQHTFSRLDIPIRFQGGRYDSVRIGDDVWIGNAAVVMADIGDHSVIAAGAVVVHPVLARTVVAGNPARVIATR